MDNRRTDYGQRITEHGLFKACELVNEPKKREYILNVAQILAHIDKVRVKCENKMLYSMSYNEWVKRNTENGIRNTDYGKQRTDYGMRSKNVLS